MFIRYWKYRRGQTLKGHYEASCIRTTDGVKVEAGPFSHTFRAIEGEWRAPEMNDFAAYSLAALSMSNSVSFTLNAAVSHSVSEQIAKLTNIYRFWAIRKLAPLRLVLPFTENKKKVTSVGEGTIICLSGGIDSTFAALQESQMRAVSHGLLIAGADYPSADDNGFMELRDRVKGISDELGLKLCVVETDIRKHRLNWDMMHSFVLAACLHFMSASHSQARIALDYAGYQELFAHPWGNNSVLPEYFSTSTMQVQGVGKEKRRVDKLAAIAEFDDHLLEHLSICFTANETGGNCGKCPKCISTRLLFQALDLNEGNVFQAKPSLADAIGQMSIPKKTASLRSRYLRISETLDALPQGKLRDKLAVYEAALRRAYVKRRRW